MFPYPFGPVYGGSVYNPSTGAESRDIRRLSPDQTNLTSRQPGRDPYTNLFGQIFGGSNYNPATGAESRDIRPLSPDDPRYGQRVPGALDALGALNALAALGGGMRPTNKLPPGYGQDSSEPFAVSGGMTGGVMRPPGDPNYVPPIADGPGDPNYVPPIADDSGMYPSPVKPAVMPTLAPQYDFGRPQPRSDISVGGNQGMQQRPSRNPSLGYNPFMGGGLGPLQNPFMGGGGFNPFMGGGYGGGFNPFMGGGGFNPFMGGGGFNPFMGGGFGRQMNPFMGGGFGGGFGGGNMGGGYGNMGGGLGGF